MVNDGSIAAAAAIAGVDLLSGGLVSNGASASILGLYRGVNMYGGAGTVINDGRITADARSSEGVLFGGGGLVTNATSGSISGNIDGVEFGGSGESGVGTVVNYGDITGVTGGGGVVFIVVLSDSFNAFSGSISGGYGVRLASGGSLTNAGTIIGNSSYGVGLQSGGTLSNSGTIIGNTGTAVLFGGTGSNLLVMDPGFSFSGLVVGSTSTSNTLELASAVSTGTVTGLGSEYLHFQSIVFDAGAEWSISGLQRGLAGPISDFALGDTIELTGVTATGSSFSGGILKLDETVGSATLDLPGTFTTAAQFIVRPAPGGGGTDVTLACFCAGTRILTASGETPVEDLHIGDQVATLRGRRLAPIVWLGHRHVNCVGHPRPCDVWPIRVKAGAIADGVPNRDLLLSPDHAVYVNDVLIPIRYLVNGATVVRESCASVTYWHVELASHDVIVAEGLPAETYLDTGNRSDFANGGPTVTVHPTFAGAVWSARACAPQLRHGDTLAALQHRVAIRAASSGAVEQVRSQTG